MPKSSSIRCQKVGASENHISYVKSFRVYMERYVCSNVFINKIGCLCECSELVSLILSVFVFVTVFFFFLVSVFWQIFYSIKQYLKHNILRDKGYKLFLYFGKTFLNMLFQSLHCQFKIVMDGVTHGIWEENNTIQTRSLAL